MAVFLRTKRDGAGGQDLNWVLAALCICILLWAVAAQAQTNSPPTISTIPDQGVFPNSTSRPIAFVIGDVETPADLLSLSAVSANTNLVPNNNIIFGGSASNRTATIIPATTQTGTTTITITVTDTNGGAGSNSFALDVAYFTPVASGISHLTEVRLAWGDYDNDGLPDLLANGYDGGSHSYVSRIFRNTGNNTFTNINAEFPNQYRSVVSWADYNRDGYLDALIAGPITQLYRNEWGTNFVAVASGLPNLSYPCSAWGDFDNDGAPDLMMSGGSGGTLYPMLYRNNGDGTFLGLTNALPAPLFFMGSADWGDFDNDGDLDLLIAGQYGTNLAKVYQNNGQAGFTETASLLGVYNGSASWGDYDNDSDLDILLTGEATGGSPVTRVYRNNGNQTFTDLGAGFAGVTESSSSWGDFDNDGRLDAIVTGLTSGGGNFAGLYRNNGDQTFSFTPAGLVGVSQGTASWVDSDRDGDLDLVLAGYPMLQFLRNNASSNSPPSAPVGLNFTLLPGNDVSLRWTAATDASTPANGLGYNLRVGTNSGGSQISSPPADLATGYRRVPQPGPAHTNRWRLVDLPKGTYYWSVQAIDPTYAGSLFSTQANFTITNGRPIISTIPTQVTYPNVAVSNVSFSVGDAETSAHALVVTKSSANTNLLPNANVILSGSGSNRSVTLIPVGNRGGEAVVTLTVTDAGGLTRSTNFTLRVEAFTPLPPIGPDPVSTNRLIYAVSWLPAVDYDNDGDLDVPFKRLTVETNTFYETFFLRNDGGGAFNPVEVGLTNIYINSLAWGDVDNDGWLDALIIGDSQVANAGINITRLYRNNRNGGFELMPVSLPLFHGGIASIADMNGDGLADLFLSGSKDENGYPQATIILLNDGNGGFAEWATDLPVISAARIFWVDIDNDGDLDLLSEIQPSSARIFRNDTGGKFTEITSGLGEMFAGVAGNPMDLDNDGLSDVFVSSYYNGLIKRNLGDGTFSTWSVGLTNLAYGSAPVMADYDNDGWADIHMAISGGGTHLYRNHGNLTFSLVDTTTPVGWFADLDGDSNLDVMADGILYRNNSAIPNTPPAAPAGLQSTQPPGDGVVLTWARSTDVQTTNSTGLYYNLRVGTTPGGVEVLSPLSDPLTGKRRVVGLGNAGQTNRWRLRDLPRGSYHWSVQAIDTAFAGSAFSTNGTFTVTRPQISEIANQQTAPGFPLIIPFTIFDVETPIHSLVLSATSANTNLVDLTNIVFGGSGTNRTVTLSPTPGLTGTNTIIITVTDGNGFTDNTTFTMIVMPFLPLGNLSIDTWDSVFPADYNNDGLMDVLVSQDHVRLWRNMGNGQFTNDATGLPFVNYGPAAWGDFDNDGWLDLAFSDRANIYRNTGSNHFSAVPTGWYEGSSGSKNVAWGDYDGDGRLDLVRVGDSASYCQLLRNTGNGTFTNSGFVPAWGYSPALGWADLDNDGQLELFVSGSKSIVNHNNHFTYIYRYAGGINFTLVSSNAILAARFPTAGFRDFDNDGDLDILIAGELASGATCRVYRNDGNFNFTNLGDLGAWVGRNAAWGDYNNDGRPDILSYSSQPTTVFLNNGNGTFTNIQANLTAVELDNAAWADFDNDGDLDVLSGKLYANLVPVANQPPQAPTGLTAVIVSNAVTLSWNPPLDDTTGSNALTYAVRLGTNSGGSQILAADADPATGFRRAVPDVSARPNRWRMVRDLPDGNYFWSVQAIDSGYAGSPFAAEASFSYFHPTIAGPSNVVLYAAAPSALVSLIVGDADRSAASLTLTAFSSSPNFLNATNIVFGGADSNRTATITLPPGTVGTAVVSIVVTDSTGLSGTNSFTVTSDYFSEQALNLPGGYNQTPCFGDYDADGDFDLYFGGQVFRNDGNWNFTLVATLPSGQRNGVHWGDYDRDGDLDLVIAGAGVTRIYRNEGGDLFTDIGVTLPDAGSAAVAWGDYDNDGDLDLAFFADVSGGFGRIYRNDGANSFVGVNAGLAALYSSGAAWGDFDNDGDLDLLASGYRSGLYSTVVYRNEDGTFVDINAGLAGVAGSSVAWGDFDQDGYLDLLVAGSVSSLYSTRVYQNNQDGTFSESSLGLPGVASGTAEWVDFNNDGYLDIFLCGASAGLPISDCATHLYQNNQNGTFSNTLASLPKSFLATWADVDSDGDGDVFLSGFWGATNRFLRNDCSRSNAPPAAPSGLSATLLPENSVLLSWLPGSDIENTNAASLSYALRAGTSPGGIDLVSPQAQATSGFRHLPTRGPLNARTWLLRDQPRGTNHWSVQTIDAAWAGSAFATEATFVITNGRPFLSAISNQFTVPGRATDPFAFTVSDFETPANELLISAETSNPNLLPLTSIVIGGTGSNRTLTLAPLPGVSGTASITLTLLDGGGLSVTSRFDVVVQTFTEVGVGLPSSTTVATAWGDYDNDGDLDIAMVGTQYGNTAVYRNTNGFFTNQNFNLPAVGYYLTPADLAWIDFDNDGDLDLTESGWLSYSSGYTPATLRLRNNLPVNTFTSISTNLPGGTVTNIADGAMAWGDYDNDGDLDVLLAGDPNTYHSPDAFTVLARNNGGVFTNSGVVLPALVRGAAVWGDYDNDGDLDLLIAGQTGPIATSSMTKLFRNDGAGGFTEMATPFPGITDCALAFGDFDNDGDLDIALAGTGTNAAPLTRIYRNTGNGVFTNLTANLKNVTYASVSWGDFDNDGFADLVVSGATSTAPYYNAATVTTTVYRNYGGVGFTNIGGTLPGVMMQNTSWGDADSDGDLDLLVGTRFVRNNWNLPNTPPTAPTNLSFAILANNDVRLSWSPATDVETTNSRGLSYNLRLGTNSGGGQVMSPSANVTNGYHRVPNLGNAGPTNFWRIANLANGTYYWSVQAIDSGLVGSAFAAEQIFILSRPVFSVISNRSVFPNTFITPIIFTVTDGETAASNLVVTASSSDTNLVADANLVVTGTGTSRSLLITPAPNRSGRVTITLTAVDESGQMGGTSFVLTVERFADIAAGLSPVVGAVAWGDYDNDGDLDLMRGANLYRNDGSNLFAYLAPIGLLSGPVSVAWGNSDNDEDLDLLIHGSAFGGVLINNGADSFTMLNPSLGGNPNSSLAWGDYDNDGDQDFLRAYSNATQLYRNDGSNSFILISAGLPIAYPGSVAWGDYDKDGDLDILIAGSGLLRVYRNNGNGTFTDLAFNLPGLYSASAAWGDFDNDGFLDFVVAGSSNNQSGGVTTRIYRSSTTPAGAGRVFTNLYPNAAQGPLGVWKGAVAWGDYDNDGDLDLLVTGETRIINNVVPTTKLYRNDNGTFTDSGQALPALKNSFAAWGDFDNDGSLDLALSGNDLGNASISRIYRNYAHGISNTPPNPPSGLTNVVTGKSVRLTWTAPSDPNQPGGLSYNLRIGSAPGAGNVLSPMAGTNGARRLVGLGNANERLTWTITNLTGGTFYWSVQAVDHSFAGSVFAPELSFVISNQVPVATSLSITLAEDTTKAITLTGSDPDADPLTFGIASPPSYGQLTGTPPNVTYRPVTNYFGFDQFTYRANDRTTDSAPAVVFIDVTPVADVASSSLGIQRPAGGIVQLTLSGEPWRSYGIEASTNLVHWVQLTNFLVTNLTTQWFDPDASNHDQRFYRSTLFVTTPEFSLTAQPGSNQFRFMVTGEVNRILQVQVSTNLPPERGSPASLRPMQ